MDNWDTHFYLYSFPPSDRLTNALADGSIDRVFTTLVIRHTQMLEDKMVEAASKLTGKTISRPTVSADKNGLKALIVSAYVYIIKYSILETRIPQKCLQSHH